MSTKINAGPPIDEVMAYSISVIISGSRVLVSADYYLVADGQPVGESKLAGLETESLDVENAAKDLAACVEEAFAETILNTTTKEDSVKSLHGLGEDYPGEI